MEEIMILPKGLTKHLIEAQKTIYWFLYNTMIVKVCLDDKHIRLNSGGYKTPHTKNCMNKVLEPYGFKVVQKKKVWYVNDMPFFDGMMLVIRQNMEA
jgi:hypothetical protein